MRYKYGNSDHQIVCSLEFPLAQREAEVVVHCIELSVSVVLIWTVKHSAVA
jgi:hypothetical protein